MSKSFSRRRFNAGVGAFFLSGCASHPSFEDWCRLKNVAECLPPETKSSSSTESKVGDDIGIAFSGGGYRAGLFHLGSIIRLNETGILSHADRISSVSGGSITSAYLGMKWDSLIFDKQGRAVNMDVEVVQPLLKFFTSHTIDFSSAISGLLPGRSSAKILAEKYDRLLFSPDLPRGRERTLQNLPNRTRAPHFVINATSLQLNNLWRFSHDRATNYQIGIIKDPEFTLGTVVAGSSAFPPFFSPLFIDLPKEGWDENSNGPFRHTEYGKRAALGDGGIYDNLGLETIHKNQKVLIVSNAGSLFPSRSDPPKNWIGQLNRTVNQIHGQAENNRKRWMFDVRGSAAVKAIALWEISQHASAFDQTNLPRLSPSDAYKAATFPTRLKRVSQADAQLLVHHGYSLAAHSLAQYFPGGTQTPATFPKIGNTH